MTNVSKWRDIGNVNMGMEDWIWERRGRVHERVILEQKEEISKQ